MIHFMHWKLRRSFWQTAWHSYCQSLIISLSFQQLVQVHVRKKSIFSLAHQRDSLLAIFWSVKQKLVVKQARSQVPLMLPSLCSHWCCGAMLLECLALHYHQARGSRKKETVMTDLSSTDLVVLQTNSDSQGSSNSMMSYFIKQISKHIRLKHLVRQTIPS